MVYKSSQETMKYDNNHLVKNGSINDVILSMQTNEEAPSSDDERNLALLPALLYISLMIILGTAGNGVVCYVYGYKLRITVTKQFILVLAVLDLANCLICAPTEMVIIFKIVSFDSPIWCKISRFITYSLNGSTSLILLAIAVDRYCKVCRPLEICFTRIRARRFCIMSVIASVLMSWPSLVLYGTKTISSGVNGTTCLIQDSYEQTWWPLVFYIVFFLLFLVIATTIIVLYVIIARQIRLLRRRQVERISNSPCGRRISGYVESVDYSEVNLTEDNAGHRDNNGNQHFLQLPCDGQLKSPSPTDSKEMMASNNENGVKTPKSNFHAKKLAQALIKELHQRKTAYKPGKSTLMLFLITMVFMLSFLPFFITAVIRGAQRTQFLESLSYSNVVIFNIFIRSYLLSNAANPIIYSFCNSKFRKECRKIFCRCLVKQSPVELRVENTDNTMSIL